MMELKNIQNINYIINDILNINNNKMTNQKFDFP